MLEPITIMSALSLVASKALGSLGGKVGAAVWTRLQGDPAQKAFKQALGRAIERYASTGPRLAVASRSWLAEDH